MESLGVLAIFIIVFFMLVHWAFCKAFGIDHGESSEQIGDGCASCFGKIILLTLVAGVIFLIGLFL